MRLSRRHFGTLLGLLGAAGGASLLLSSACDIDPSRAPDRQTMLRDLVANVVVPTYADLASATAALQQSVAALRTAPDADKLAAAQRQYRAARAVHKSSEAMFFGPADDLTITAGAIDAWPANGPKLDALIAGTAGIGASDVTRLGANQRGFPGLEHLLFDSAVSDVEVLARFQQAGVGARRGELAESLASELAGRSRALADAFAGPTGYGAKIAEAGVGSTEFRSQAEGVDKLLTSLVYVSDLMVMKKLAEPLGIELDGVVQPDREEGPRSDSSLDDLRNNLLGLQSVYTGERGALRGQGLATPVRAQNARAATHFEQLLADALAKVNTIPPPLRTALVASRPQVEAAYKAIHDLRESLVTEVAGALGSSIGFGLSDTD